MPENCPQQLPGGLAEILVKGALHRERGFWVRLRRHFFTGLLVVTPLGLTLWIVTWLVNLVDGNTRRFLASMLSRFGLDYGFTIFGREYSVVPFGFGILIVFFGICFIGMVASNFVGSWLLQVLDRIIRRVPGVNWIYNATTQISHAFLNRNKSLFERVVLVEYPRPGLYGIGFVTASGIPGPSSSNDQKVNAVFLPRTPNAASGVFLLVPENECIPCAMTVEEGMKVVISGGVVVPASLRNGAAGPPLFHETSSPPV
jgi:uncharacterized membrane protein